MIDRAGTRPGGRPSFFASPKKEGKERRPRSPCPCAFRAGQPALLAKRGRTANSLRSNMRPDYPPVSLRYSARAEGTPRAKAKASDARRQTLRHDPGCGLRGPSEAMARVTPLLGVPRSGAFCGELGRACLSEASLRGPPRKASTAGCPARTRRDTPSGVAFLCLLSLAKQRKSGARRGETRHGSSFKTKARQSHRRLHMPALIEDNLCWASLSPTTP
jgi:hypothetical protein